MKVFACGQCTLLSTSRFLPHALTLEKGDGPLLAVGIVARQLHAGNSWAAAFLKEQLVSSLPSEDTGLQDMEATTTRGSVWVTVSARNDSFRRAGTMFSHQL